MESQITENDVFKFKMKPRLIVRWEPEPDITIFELAKCLPFLFHANHFPTYDIPDLQEYPYLRHFKFEKHEDTF